MDSWAGADWPGCVLVLQEVGIRSADVGSSEVPEKILVVDDEHYVLEATVRRLRGRGYDVTGAESGMEALEQIAEEPFELLLLDIKMPGIGGLELLRRAREMNPEVMALIVTGYGNVENAIEAMELGALGFVRKPVPIEELTAAIEGALTRGRLRSENARLRALMPLFELSKVILSEVDEEKLLHLILETVVSEMGTDFAEILFRDNSGDLMRRATHGLPATGSIGEMVSDDLAVEAVSGLEPVVASNAGGKVVASPEETEVVQEACRIYVPLVVRGEVIGVLMTGRVEGETSFQQSDVEFLCTLCGQGAIAIANAQLFESVQRKQAEVEGLLQRVVNTAENERLKLSLELHDGPTQSIIGSQCQLETCRLFIDQNQLNEAGAKLAAAQETLTESIRELRRIVRDLQPQSVSNQGLVIGIREYLNSIERDEGIGGHLEINGTVACLDAFTERGVYYVVREALTNVKKHSNASEARVLLDFGVDSLTVNIADNGIGLNRCAEQWESSDGHLGMRSMKERARMMNGNITIDSKPGEGTIVKLFVPISNSEEPTEAVRPMADEQVAGSDQQQRVKSVRG